MSLFTRLAYLILFPAFACSFMLLLIPSGLDVSELTSHNLLGLLAMWVLATTLVVNIAGVLEQRFLSTLLLFATMLGVVVPTILFAPVEHVDWSMLRTFAIWLVAIPFLVTILSGYRKVPHGTVMKVHGKLKTAGEQYYYLPFFMEEPTRADTEYRFTMRGNALNPHGAPIVLVCSFSCVLDPVEAVKEGIPFESIRERAQQSLRNVVDSVLVEHAHPTLSLSETTEHILSLKKGFSLPSLGARARGVVENFTVKLP